MRARGGAGVVVGGVALALVAACASHPRAEPTTEPTAEPTAEPTSELPTSSSSPTLAFDPGSGEHDLVLHDVRVGAHDGYDRIVLEFTGSGVAGWSVQYVDRARLEGSGDAVRLAGAAFLDIYASHTTWPAPGYYDGPQRLVPDDEAGIDEVYVGGTFEGYTQVLAGISDGARTFRVFTLEQPSRLVIDVVDPEVG